MNSSSFKIAAGKLGLILLAFVFVACAGTATAAKQELPDIDSDGLHLVKDSKVRVAYAKPGASLSNYTKVALLDCFVEFKKDWARDYNLDQIGLEGRVSNKDVEEIKQKLADEFREVFTEELTKSGHEVVDVAGPDVLLLRPAIINLDVNAPDIMRSGRSSTWVESAGEMTLYMEFYDSATNELIARVVDPREADNTTMSRSSSVSNKAEADYIIRRWAKLLIDHLGEITQAP